MIYSLISSWWTLCSICIANPLTWLSPASHLIQMLFQILFLGTLWYLILTIIKCLRSHWRCVCRMHLVGVEPMSLVMRVFFRPVVLCKLQYFANKFIHLLWKMVLFLVVMLRLEMMDLLREMVTLELGDSEELGDGGGGGPRVGKRGPWWRGVPWGSRRTPPCHSQQREREKKVNKERGCPKVQIGKRKRKKRNFLSAHV